MKRHLLYIAMSISCLLTAFAQPNYRNAELKRLGELISLSDSILSDGYHYQTFQGLPIVVHLKNLTIDQIGLCLFSDELHQQEHASVLDFLERYFLQLKYPPTDKTAQTMTRDDDFVFLTGSLATVEHLLPSDAFSFSYDRQFYQANWLRGGETILSVMFPVAYELISGENKIEAENNLYHDVMNTLVIDQPQPQSSDEHYISERFSSRLYLHRGKLVMSERHPAESAANILLSPSIEGDFTIQLTQLSYGFRKTTFEVPLRQWTAYCLQAGCLLYYGVENVAANGNVEAVVIAVNEAENYNHVLTVTIPSDAIRQRCGSLEAKLYPFVPTHYVKNLFGEYRKSNPKTFVNP